MTQHSCRNYSFSRSALMCAAIIATLFTPGRLWSQQALLGNITGTVSDTTGAVVQGAKVTARNLGTNLEQSAVTKDDGSYEISDLPIGTYSMSIAKQGFQTEEHTQIIVQGNRTATVNGKLQPGLTTTTVEVIGTPLMNQVDTTNGYILDSSTIDNSPLGTGSFTQLAILSPGVSADFLGGSGTNSGLGNQSIFANGQRDSSNSFSMNGIEANNLFNGKTTSQVGANRFVLSTGENFLGGGEIQTNTSVYDAIGQGLPTPPPDTIQELRVNTSMYDASQGAHSGAHVEVITKSGTNQLHGSGYGIFETSDWNAAPFFRNASAAIPGNQKVPYLERNVGGGTLGGPIIKDKLFFFASYQVTRTQDQLVGTSTVAVPIDLTDDRSAAALAAVANKDFSPSTPIAPSQIVPQAAALLTLKTKSGSYFFPTPTITDPNQESALGYDAIVQGPNGTFNADQYNGNIDYQVNNSDRLSGKYFYQNNPTATPFSSGNGLLGFPQTLEAGAHSFSLANTTILTPSLTWEEHIGFTRQRAYANTGQAITPQQIGINLFGSTRFPGIYLTNPDGNFNSFNFGPASPFSNAGMFQNQFPVATTLSWVKGRHTLSFGFNWNYAQLNVINRNTDVASIGFFDFPSFLTGTVTPGVGYSSLFSGSADRYYRSNTAGAFVNDNFRLKPNLFLTFGLRWDYDGPLSEKHGFLTNFYPELYQYDASTDTIVNSGLVIAGNNKQFHTPGVSDSTMRSNQYGFAPRIGVAWTPGFVKNVVLRAGYGLYYDRGEFFSEFSPSAGNGYNGPFGVTMEPPFVVPFPAVAGATFANPFGTTPPPPPPGTAAAFTSLLPNLAATTGGANPFLFGGYDSKNRLPFTQNWTADLQWQPWNSVLFDLAYVGNHGQNLTLPLPFNQPGIATPQHPINGQSYSYGWNLISSENVVTADGGNVDIRVPYLGYSPNSVFYRAVGISNYNALQFGVRKRLSFGLQFTASYTWSHSLDEQSGLGLFFNGNDPNNPRSAYGNSDFDRTHVFSISYLYMFPKAVSSDHSLMGFLANGWGISGVTTAQSGEPYNVYDYSGALASIYYGFNDYITNPIVGLAPGQTASSAQLQGTTGVNAGHPVLNKSSFAISQLAPGQDGVPPCDASGCDTFETGYSAGGRNIFRGPFQTRFDTSVFKEIAITERVRFRYSADFFNLFNHPSFDTPNNDVTFYNVNFSSFPPGVSLYNPPRGSLGFIQHTIGSPRFIQMTIRLTF